MKKVYTYGVWAKTDHLINIEIKAESLEDAVAKSKELKEEDFVEVLGEYADGNFEITGVLRND